MKSDELEIRTVIQKGKHVIPSYQRGYAWTKENIDDFWRDILDHKLGHFLGSFVVKSNDGNEKDVIDGQQRITTSIISLAAIRDYFDKYGADRLASGIHDSLIYFKNERGELEARLVNENDDIQRELIGNILARPSSRSAFRDLSSEPRK